MNSSERPGGPIDRVRPGSPLAAALAAGRGPDRPMPWSLGLLGDLMWMRLPESRPFLARLIADEVEDAIEVGRALTPLLPGTIASHALWHPLLRPALERYPAGRDRVAGHLRFVHDAYRAEGPGQGPAREALNDYVLDWLREPSYRAIVAEADPALSALLDQR